MTITAPIADVGKPFSSPDAEPTPWTEVRSIFQSAEIYWLSTVRKNGAPHATPLIGIWHNEAFHFCTGTDEQKAVNLRTNQHVVITTGNNEIGNGTDVVVEGVAEIVSVHSDLEQLAVEYKSKYGWEFGVADGHFTSEGGGPALVYRVAPIKAFSFRRGDNGAQSRYRFRA